MCLARKTMQQDFLTPNKLNCYLNKRAMCECEAVIMVQYYICLTVILSLFLPLETWKVLLMHVASVFVLFCFVLLLFLRRAARTALWRTAERQTRSWGVFCWPQCCAVVLCSWPCCLSRNLRTQEPFHWYPFYCAVSQLLAPNIFPVSKLWWRTHTAAVFCELSSVSSAGTFQLQDWLNSFWTKEPKEICVLYLTLLLNPIRARTVMHCYVELLMLVIRTKFTAVLQPECL